MSPLVRELLVNGLMAGTAVRTAKKTSIGFGYYAAAGAVAFVGFIFFAIAGFYYLQTIVTADIAAAIVGGVMILIGAGIAAAGYYHLERKKILRKPAHDGSFIDMVENTLKSVIDGFEEPVKDNPKLALLMAALAGFAAGDKMGDRIH